MIGVNDDDEISWWKIPTSKWTSSGHKKSTNGQTI